MRGVTRLVEWFRHMPPLAADAAVAVLIFLVGTIEILYFQDSLTSPPFHIEGGLPIALFAAMSLPLAVRRRHLLAVYVFIETAAVVAGQIHSGVAIGLGALLVFNVLLYSVGEQTNGFVTAGATVGQLGYWFALEFEVAAKNRTFLDDALFLLPFFGFAAFAGWAQRRRRRLTEQLTARVAEVERERDLLAAQAVTGERLRIAQELRALVIEGVDRMTRAAASARLQLERRPDRLPSEIEMIEVAGRATLVEMRRLLGVLRRSDEDRDRRPALDPGLEAVGAPIAANAPGAFHIGLTGRIRHWLRSPSVVDVLIVGAIGTLAVIEFAHADPSDQTMAGTLPKILSVLILVSLMFRRRAPFTVLSVVAGCEFVWILATNNSPGSADRALMVAIYTVAAYKGMGWGVAAVGMGVFAWSPLPLHQVCICLIDIGALSTFAAIAGHSMLVGRRINGELQEQTDLLLRTRRERVRLAVSEERGRVAREMHDVVAHAMSGMVVQAGGARMIASTDPSLAMATMEDIEQLGKDALRELRGLVRTLEPPASLHEGYEPLPDVDSLVNREQRAGQNVAISRQGPPVVDPGLQISLYRIVQEALTNVRKHAPGASVAVSVRSAADGVDVEVVNGPAARPGFPGTVPGAGLGLAGIRERAAVFGGWADAGPTPDGGFRVSAHLYRELALV